MNDTPSTQRPLAPKTIEEELKAALADRVPQNGAFRAGMIPAGGVYPRDLKLDPVLGGVAAKQTLTPVTPMPTGAYVAERLARLVQRLRTTDANASSIATTLAGPSSEAQTAQGEQSPAPSLFVVYVRALDEIDRIVDTIDNEQARTRNILGD